MNGPGRTLHVVTHRRWLADDFSAALTDTGIEVRHSLGLDLPDACPGDAVWAPMEWMARARHTGAAWHLADPGPRFLARVPRRLLGRDVHAETLGRLSECAPDEGFFKPANMKAEQAPAQWWHRDDFIAAAYAAGLVDGSLVQWSDERLDLAEEHRVYVLDGLPVTSSVYLRHHRDSDSAVAPETWHEAMSDPLATTALRFATDVLTGLRSTHAWPRSFTLDLARLTDTETGAGRGIGGWVVLETNPVWSSNPYGCDLAAVAECLFAAADPTGGFDWEPDPALVAVAARQRRLAS